MALLTGFIVAYPMNWWLVANHLKHGMMTVRKGDQTDNHQSTPARGMDHHAAMLDSGYVLDPSKSADDRKSSKHGAPRPSAGMKGAMTLLSFVVFGLGLVVAWALTIA